MIYCRDFVDLFIETMQDFPYAIRKINTLFNEYYAIIYCFNGLQKNFESVLAEVYLVREESIYFTHYIAHIRMK